MTDPRDRLLEDMAKALQFACERIGFTNLEIWQEWDSNVDKALASYKAWKEGKKQ